MNTKLLKNFAQNLRAELDKTTLSLSQKKDVYISVICDMYARKAGAEEFYLKKGSIPEDIKQKFSSDILSGELSHVEILGWLYQYFVDSDRAGTVDAIGGHDISDEKVSSATQVFTPEWIVKYLVDNSLGRVFCESGIQGFETEYFLKNPVSERSINDIKNITFFDPSCGGGNILVYAFDVFMKAYSYLGYSPQESAENILKFNLYGADIDPFAARLCSFSLSMKAREYGAKSNANISCLDHLVAGTLTFDDRVCILNRKYTVVCTNPPYLSKIGGDVKKYLNLNMKPYSGDLFTAFMYRGLQLCETDGYMAYMTPNVWMFLSSHKKIREYILDNKTIYSLFQLGKGAYFSEASVDICAFVIKNAKENKSGIYIRGENFPKNLASQSIALKNAVSVYNSGKKCEYVYVKDRDYFSHVPDRPLAYWVTENVHNAFKQKNIGDMYVVKQGMTTGNNKKFLRYWYKVPFDAIGFNMPDSIFAKKSGKKWFPYNKGGKFRKWYGNNDYVVLYENDGEEMKEYTSHLPQGTWVRLKSRDYYFKESVTWSFISSSHFGVRFSPVGSIFDVAGSSLFGDDLLYVLAFLSTKTAFYLLQVINPSMNYQIRDVKSLPFILDGDKKEYIQTLAKSCMEISKKDWDSQENSYGFSKDPLVILGKKGVSLKESIAEYIDLCQKRFDTILKNENEIGYIFAKNYSLIDDIDYRVYNEDITIRVPNEKELIQNLISYCVGCAVGRFDMSENGVLSCNKKVLSLDYIADYVKNLLCSLFPDSEYILNFSDEKNLLDAIYKYIKKDFIKNHNKQYHNKPIYFKTDDMLLYDIEKEM